jgi:hypothetical protein
MSDVKLRSIFSTILKKYGIDDLGLEMELASAATAHLTGVKSERDVRKEIETAFLTGQVDHRTLLDIASYTQEKLCINPTGSELEARWTRFYEHAFRRNGKGEKIEKFISWWMENNPDPKYWSPERMITYWPQAFRIIEKEEADDKWSGVFTEHL